MNRDHITINRLEKILEDSRKETMASQTNTRELQCEVNRLKQRICELQNKLSTESTELRKYQTQAAEYNKQICELRRQVTNERFERAKLQESNYSPERSCRKSENINNKNKVCFAQPNRLKCCQCEVTEPVWKQHTHRCGIAYIIPENQRTSGTQTPYNDEGRCFNKRLSAETAVHKSKTASTSTSTSISIDSAFSSAHETNSPRINNLDNIAKINEGPAALCDRSHNDTCANERNSQGQINESPGYPKANPNNSTVCQCQLLNKIKQHTPPYWMLQTLNLVNKLLEERSAKRERIYSNTDRDAEHCASKCEQIGANEPTPINNNSVNVSGSTSARRLLEILADIQRYTQNINEHFKIINKRRSADDRRAIPTCSKQPRSQDHHRMLVNSDDDMTLPTEKLSLQSFVYHRDDEERIHSSTPRKNTNDFNDLNGSTGWNRSCRRSDKIMGMPLNPGLSSSKDMEYVDSESSNITSKTEYKSLPKLRTRGLNGEPSACDLKLNETRSNDVSRPHVQSIQQKIDRLRNDIMCDLAERKDQKLGYAD
ncbi:PREDICTED: uncharacterized protein LOC105360379 [Ceratosolen solmsi marchali]|uniref:Uncharacterized protein LOC105360379 n=1 Tax=Ceratosolen solmsi marchali TaxID=326594 RepID=A0AAJ6VM60_9HYME|nr:PREDICTED: uncharacterized protein LOC105360379 [Ceratosolen solmsi marchali]